jgi:dipeptidyl-peptidase-4
MKISIHFSLFVLALFLQTAAFAQENGTTKTELTLKDAVLGQMRIYGPDRAFGVQWLPESDMYTCFNKTYQSMVMGNAAEPEQKLGEILTVEKMNKILGSELTSFFGLEWLNLSEFIINDGIHFYWVDALSDQGKLLNTLDETAENGMMHKKSFHIAYTIENNVYVKSKEGEKRTVTNNTDKNIVSGQAIARSEFGISGGLFWSNSGNHLAFYQKDEAEVHDYPLLDISQTPGELMSIKYPMAGQKSEKPRVGIYDLTSKQTVYISPKGAADDYLTNFVFTPDDQFVILAEVNRDQNHMMVNLYEVKTGKFVRTLFEESNEKWVEPEHAAYFPSSKSNNFIWISERDGFSNLYYYDINGKLITQLTKHAFVVKDILGATPDGTTVYYSATGENPLNTLVYSVSVTPKHTPSKRITLIDGTHEVQLSSSGKYIFDAYSNHDIDYHACILNPDGKIIKQIMVTKDKLSDVKIGTAEINTLTAADGTKLYTRLIKPSNFDPSKKYPVMVYVYGGPHAQMITNSWLDGANLWMYWMAEQGYLVYTLDGRGSAYRGFADESQIHRQLGTVEMNDQLEGVKYLKSLSYVDSNRLAVHGWSFGGFMTTSFMLRYPDVFQVGVAGGPVTDWKYYEIMYGERYMDRPEQNVAGYEKASLLTHAKNLKGDLLLIHGTVDDVVVMQHNYALVKKFVELGIQMDFFPYPMHKHNVTGKDRVHLMDKVLNYIIDNNQ